jgi:hypothetical protein
VCASFTSSLTYLQQLRTTLLTYDSTYTKQCPLTADPTYNRAYLQQCLLTTHFLLTHNNTCLQQYPLESITSYNTNRHTNNRGGTWCNHTVYNLNAITTTVLYHNTTTIYHPTTCYHNTSNILPKHYHNYITIHTILPYYYYGHGHGHGRCHGRGHARDTTTATATTALNNPPR